MQVVISLSHRDVCFCFPPSQRKAKKKQILCDLCVSAVIINYPIIIQYRIYEYMYLFLKRECFYDFSMRSIDSIFTSGSAFRSDPSLYDVICLHQAFLEKISWA